MAGSPSLVDPSGWRRTLLDRTERVDALVSKLSVPFFAAVGNARVAILAVGGYGRRELFPHSDIDLLFLTASEPDLAAIKDPLSDLVRQLWDEGLRVSQSAHTLAECCQLNEQNIELHISLLDVRFLAGDAQLFRELEESLSAFYQRHRHTLSSRLAELTSARHSKFNNTVFHLEPNIKESPGGIRDIHFLHWLDRLNPENEALRESLLGAEDARAFLYPLRAYLHERSGRDNNLLTFELQDEAARVLGNGADPAQWMRQYFLFARQTWQSAGRVLEFVESLDRSLFRQVRDSRSKLSTTDYTVSHDHIFLRNPQEATQDAASVLRLFTFSARHGLPLSWDAQRRLRSQISEIAEKFAAQPALWSAWSELLSQPHAGVALHEMQETGVLAAAIPEWNAIDGLVVRDFYHRYTVDEHTLVAIGVIDDLANHAEGTAKRMRRLLKEVDDRALLRFSLLLHDIGKGTDPGEHVRGSLVCAETIMQRLGVPGDQRRTIRFLIEHHLDLPVTMNGRDLDDPVTARALAAQMQTLERLRYLTLHTYADISAVNPTAMTPWRLEQLWRVYVMGQEQLTRELETDRIRGIEDLPEEDRTPQLIRFLQGLPTRYLRTHTAEEIRSHGELQAQVRAKKVAVAITSRKGAFHATVLAEDKPGLFAAICGAFASFGVNIVKAEAFNNDLGLVLDEFRFTDPLRSLELNPTEVDRLRRTVERVVLGAEDVRLLLRRRRVTPRPARVAYIVPSVRFNNEASDTATLVYFTGEDRPGLLYDLASTFAANGCNIEIVLIDTEGHKAIDVFYVTSGGAKLEEELERRLQADLIRAAEGALATPIS